MDFTGDQNRDHVVIDMPEEMDVLNADDNVEIPGIPRNEYRVIHENDVALANNRGKVYDMILNFMFTLTLVEIENVYKCKYIYVNKCNTCK